MYAQSEESWKKMSTLEIDLSVDFTVFLLLSSFILQQIARTMKTRISWWWTLALRAGV